MCVCACMCVCVCVCERVREIVLTLSKNQHYQDATAFKAQVFTHHPMYRTRSANSRLYLWSAIVDNIRWRIVGAMFRPSNFGDDCRCDVSTSDLRRLMFRPLEINVSTFEDQCFDL